MDIHLSHWLQDDMETIYSVSSGSTGSTYVPSSDDNSSSKFSDDEKENKISKKHEQTKGAA
ncbi:7969_t:CDS:2, partial [Entrophospora sp. SA101]